METLAPLFALTVLCITVYSVFELVLNRKKSNTSKGFEEKIEQELSERNKKSEALEERIRILEKIVTDNHSSQVLSEEIDQLKEQAHEQ